MVLCVYVNSKFESKKYLSTANSNMEFNTKNIRGELKHMEPMANHTSWRTGGLAEFFYKACDLDDLCHLLASLPEDIPVTWIGFGSNLLVRDGGVKGVVIAITGVLDELELIGANRLLVGAGVGCPKVAKFSVKAGLTGAEFLAGIPGTMGGALTMNAGAFGSETWDLVISVETLDRNGDCHVRRRQEFNTGYRHVDLFENEWFINCELSLDEGQDMQGEKRIRELLAQRAEKQPLGQLSCGSVFRNPPNDYAARLIEYCGLKGKCIGGACVSEKHANFIINQGSATATDIENLITHVRDTVKQRCKVDLIPEVRIIGEQTNEEIH
jgi:UDP-N-acetylmuramate dehydrogenase